MNETQKLAAIVAPISWLAGLIGWLILHFTLGGNWSFSFILGLLTGLLNLGFMAKGSKHMLKEIEKEEEGSPVRANMIYFFLRVIVFAGIFAMMITDQFVYNKDNPKFNVWAGLIGYVLQKIILMVVSIILKRREDKKCQ